MSIPLKQQTYSECKLWPNFMRKQVALETPTVALVNECLGMCVMTHKVSVGQYKHEWSLDQIRNEEC